MQSHHLTNPKTCPTAWGHFCSVLREVLDKQSKRIDGMHEDTIMRIDGLISRNDKSAQQLSAMAKQIAALERRLQPKG